MCGIAGILFADRSRPIGHEFIHAMGEAIAHRGPDARGLWQGHGVALAHVRLSIIDLDGGQQPLSNEDGTIHVVFNGEIYNYRELRAELIARGHCFKTNSDTEVLVHLYEELGPEFVTRLRGMFAFAIWDARREQLMLARDRVGQKPLYYTCDSNRVLFGSELKAILADSSVEREIDLESLEDYLTFGVVPGEKSIIRGIQKLPPAHYLVVDRQKWEAQPFRYWSLKEEVDEDRSEADWLELVRNKFRETVQAHRIADVPIGAFLSGGLDSSAVVAELAEAGGTQLTTFSIGFHEEQFSELPYARKIAQRYGTRHIEAVVTPQAVSSLEELVHYYDEPFADASAIPMMHVSRLAAEHVKVVLSGDGGDEAFGGYRRYAHDLKEASVRRFLPKVVQKGVFGPLAKCWPKADWLPRMLRAKTAFTNLSLSNAQAYANTISIYRNPLRRQLLQNDVRSQLNGYRPESRIWRAYGEPGSDALRGMIAADIGMLLPDDFLTKVDRASMAFGLEVRPPMVDHEFLELTARIPSRLKVNSGRTKWIFKRMCDGWLPDGIVHRPKQGFEIPIDDWLRGPLNEMFVETVLSSNSRVSDYLDRKRIRTIYDAHQRKVGHHGQQLWSILVLAAWMDRHLSTPVASPQSGAMVQECFATQADNRPRNG